MGLGEAGRLARLWSVSLPSRLVLQATAQHLPKILKQLDKHLQYDRWVRFSAAVNVPHESIIEQGLHTPGLKHLQFNFGALRVTPRSLDCTKGGEEREKMEVWWKSFGTLELGLLSSEVPECWQTAERKAVLDRTNGKVLLNCDSFPTACLCFAG